MSSPSTPRTAVVRRTDPAAHDGDTTTLKDALRGLPREGEDWDTQGLMEIVVARAVQAGYRATVSQFDEQGRQLLMIATKQTGAFTRAPVMKISCKEWDLGGAGQDWGDWSVEQIRNDLLERAVNGLTILDDAWTTQDVLGDPYRAVWSVHHRLDAALTLWWQARLDEGQTPETARMLLGLLAHPSVMAMVEADAEGNPVLPPLRKRGADTPGTTVVNQP